MRILFVNPFYAPDVFGGAEVVLQSLVEGLAARGVDVSVVATTDEKGLHREEVNGVRVWRAGLRNLFWHRSQTHRPGVLARSLWRAIDIYNPLMMEHVNRVVSEDAPTVASVHNLSGWSVSAWSVLLSRNIPIVQVLHDYQLMCRGLMYTKNGNCLKQCISCRAIRYPHKRLSSRISGVVGVSRAILKRYEDAGFFQGVAQKRVIHNTRTATELIGALPSNAQQEKDRPFRFGYIGALAAHKGVELLLREFVARLIPGAELWIAGSGEEQYTAHLKEIARGTPVVFLGRVAQQEFYSAVDVVIVPSLWEEPLTTVILEALALGKPVICSSRGGNEEMVVSGINGLVFDPDLPMDLSATMFEMRETHRLLGGMKSRGDREALFSDPNLFLEEHLSIYRSVQPSEQ